MANIREVAEEAGVSIASVSRILNKDASFHVATKTRNKIFKAAEELGYSLESDKPKNLARVKKIACIKNVTAENDDDEYYIKILEGLRGELSKHDYYVEYIKSQYDINDIGVLKKIFKNGIGGIILMTAPGGDALQIIKSHAKAVVCVDTMLTEYDNVRYNRFEAGCIAMYHLIEKGHKKIAYVGANISNKFRLTFGRYDAYRLMLRRIGIDINPDWILDCKWQRQLCYEQTKALLKSKNLPTAIFYASDYMAFASIEALREEKVKIPDDISIIGISDLDESKYLDPPLTTVNIPQYDIGRIAASTLLARLNGDITPPKQIYVPIKLAERESVKKITDENQ